jgi:beta-ureidopropionase / N-carbamoyl-L-amino-acid hydrolase
MGGMPGSLPDDVRIDGARLGQRLAALAEIGAIAGTAGAARLALTEEDRAGRDLVTGWMRDLGMAVTVDAIGNVVGLRPGREDLAPVMTGSHIDTVGTGGRYDGNLGVLAGLELVETLERHRITTRRPLAVAFFTNEEGSRFPPDMMGSLVYVGGLAVEDAHDTIGIDGKRVGDELARIGYLGSHPCPGPAPHAFVELHIEQGPVLEEAAVEVGVVTGVQGISWTEVTVEGQSNHAGTTPMRLRHDAGYVAAEIAVFARRLAVELGGPQVATVGSIELHPNLVNVVAARATLTVDLRNTDDEVLCRAEARLAAHLDQLAASEGVAITTRTLARFAPVTFDDRLVDLVEQVAKEQGRSTMRLPSGAGHDAQMLARVCPTAMVFTPSHRGISHNPAEHTDPQQLAAGADVLCQVLLRLADEEPGDALDPAPVDTTPTRSPAP